MDDLRRAAAPLLNFFDLDPERCKPMNYAVNIDVRTIADGQGMGSVTLRNQPFILVKIAHSVIGQTADPESSGLYNDGQYSIEMTDEQRTYGNIALMSDLMAGPKVQGDYPELIYPIYYAGTHTLKFLVTNHYARILSPVSDYFRVQIALLGLADWGTLTPPNR